MDVTTTSRAVDSSISCSQSNKSGSVSETGRPAVLTLTIGVGNSSIKMFTQQPHRTDLSDAALVFEMQKALPEDFRNAKLSHDGEQIKNLIGVMYEDITQSGNDSDKKKLQSICSRLIKAQGNEKKEKKVRGDLVDLVSKYSAKTLTKLTNTFIDHCEDAWKQHHDNKSIPVEGKTVFTASLDSCKSVMMDLMQSLSAPDMPWETIAQKMRQATDTCSSISKTLTFYNNAPDNSAPEHPPVVETEHPPVAEIKRPPVAEIKRPPEQEKPGPWVFKTAPGAFTGKAATYAPIITTERGHDALNHRTPSPQHFNRPAATTHPQSGVGLQAGGQPETTATTRLRPLAAKINRPPEQEMPAILAFKAAPGAFTGSAPKYIPLVTTERRHDAFNHRTPSPGPFDLVPKDLPLVPLTDAQPSGAEGNTP